RVPSFPTRRSSDLSVGAIKAGVTVLGALATAYAGYCGAKIAALAERANERGEKVQVEDATTPTAETNANIASWQRQQKIVQYLVPVMAGANIALGSYLTGSYRPAATLRGIWRTMRRNR